MLPVVAMSIHNTILKTYVPDIPPCSVMTGNLIQFVVNTTTFCFHLKYKGSQQHQEYFTGLKRFGNVLFGFFVGAWISALGYIYLKFYALIFILVMQGLMILLVEIKD